MTAPANATPLERLCDAVAQHLTTVRLALETTTVGADTLDLVGGSADRLTEALARARSDAPRDALHAVAAERRRQDRIWGEQNHEPTEYLAILVEEVGEAAKEAVEARWGDAIERPEHLRQLRRELIQTAAVAVAMCEAIDRREVREIASERAARAKEAPRA